MTNKILAKLTLTNILYYFGIICVAIALLLLFSQKVDAAPDRPLPFRFNTPHVVKTDNGVLIEFRMPIPARVIILKNNIPIYDKKVIAGNIRVTDRQYRKGDTYKTAVMFCAPLTEIPSRHCYHTPVYGPYTPDNWYWKAWR